MSLVMLWDGRTRAWDMRISLLVVGMRVRRRVRVRLHLMPVWEGEITDRSWLMQIEEILVAGGVKVLYWVKASSMDAPRSVSHCMSTRLCYVQTPVKIMQPQAQRCDASYTAIARRSNVASQNPAQTMQVVKTKERQAGSSTSSRHQYRQPRSLPHRPSPSSSCAPRPSL